MNLRYQAIKSEQARHVHTVQGVSFYRHKRVSVGFLDDANGTLHNLCLVVFDPQGIYTTVKPVGATTGVFGRTGIERPEDLIPGKSYVTKLDIPAERLMKYSHHVDGTTHFSDGRGPSLDGTRTRTFPLTEEGRIFEITANFPEEFETFTKTKSNRAYALLRANLEGHSISVTGHWYPFASYLKWRDEYGGTYGPAAIFERKGGGKPFQTLLVGPDEDVPTGLLMVGLGLVPRAPSETTKSLVMMGGWIGMAAAVIGRFPDDFTKTKPRDDTQSATS